jgi:hypothetical protein
MAAGDTLLIFTPLQCEQPVSNPATFDARNAHPCLDFDDTTNESAVFSGVMPQNYAGGGVTVYLHFSASTAQESVKTVTWLACFERIGDQQLDIDSDSFVDVNSGQGTASTTSGLVDIASIAFTNGADMDSVAAGEAFRIKITRDPEDTSEQIEPDDAGGDAELLRVEIRETAA